MINKKPNFKVKELLKNFKVPVFFGYLLSDGVVGYWDPDIDKILIDRDFKANYPCLSLLTLYHEIFHSTLSRTGRIDRLFEAFGPYKFKSQAYRVEECIAEICVMVLCKKLGILNKAIIDAIDLSFEQYYDSDIYIPWDEVVKAVNYYTGTTDVFTHELNFIRSYTRHHYGLAIKDKLDDIHNNESSVS